MTVRVRFAPSPTGDIHLGNIRIALFNYLFARQKGGKIILRIEDTDAERNIEGASHKIESDLKWLGVAIDEGPFFQSERTKLYDEKLFKLIEHQKVYRCFCTSAELDLKRKKYLALKKPPRYDRTCFVFSDDVIKQKIEAKLPFIWRLQLNHDAMVEIDGMARGKTAFELKNFSDVALTRSDGSFTFMFVNFVDDWLMGITHVIRGEDHLTNSALQAALFDAFSVPLPTFWHLPFLCDAKGKKLSKREPGFALDDLRTQGFLPQAICNYLAILTGTHAQEVQSLQELVQNFDFENLHGTGSIRYDNDKLRWLNHQWIERIAQSELVERVRPYLEKAYPQSTKLSDEKLGLLVSKIKSDLETLGDIATALKFYFVEPELDDAAINAETRAEISGILDRYKEQLGDPEVFVKSVQHTAKQEALKAREVWGYVRYRLTGSFDGPSVRDLIEMLGAQETRRRLGL